MDVTQVKRFAKWACIVLVMLSFVAFHLLPHSLTDHLMFPHML